MELLTVTRRSRILPCWDLTVSTSFSRLTSTCPIRDEYCRLLTNQRPVFTWSRTLSPARRPSRAIRHAVVTRSGRWVCSMLACSWYLRQQAAVSSS